VVYLSLLRATDAYFSTQGGDVPAAEFKAYFDGLHAETNFEGLRGIGMLGMAGAKDTALLESTILRLQGIEKVIRPEQTENEWRAPIVLYGPLVRPEMSGLGFDMFSDPERRETILSAIDTDEPRATGRLLLGQATGGEIWPGFLIFSAVDDK